MTEPGPEARCRALPRQRRFKLQRSRVAGALALSPRAALPAAGLERVGGGPFVPDKGIAPGERVAAGVEGGGPSRAHPGPCGMSLVIGAVTPWRGDAGERQAAGLDAALVQGGTPPGHCDCAALPGTASAS